MKTELLTDASEWFFSGLKFRQHHLELDANPKDLHRDYQVRRISYGNATHLNIAVIVNKDNKARLVTFEFSGLLKILYGMFHPRLKKTSYVGIFLKGQFLVFQVQ